MKASNTYRVMITCKLGEFDAMFIERPDFNALVAAIKLDEFSSFTPSSSLEDGVKRAELIAGLLQVLTLSDFVSGTSIYGGSETMFVKVAGTEIGKIWMAKCRPIFFDGPPDARPPMGHFDKVLAMSDAELCA